MPVVVNVIFFRLNVLEEYEARVGGVAITVSPRGGGQWAISIDAYETLTVPPCHEEYFDVPACEAGKNLDEVDDYDACELTCPVMKQVEAFVRNTYIWGDILSDVIREARRELRGVDEQYGDQNFNQVDAKMFLEGKWRISGVLY